MTQKRKPGYYDTPKGVRYWDGKNWRKSKAAAGKDDLAVASKKLRQLFKQLSNREQAQLLDFKSNSSDKSSTYAKDAKRVAKAERERQQRDAERLSKQDRTPAVQRDIKTAQAREDRDMREFYGLPNRQSDDALRGYKEPTPEPKAKATPKDSKPKSTPRRVKYPTASEMQAASKAPKSSTSTASTGTSRPAASSSSQSLAKTTSYAGKQPDPKTKQPSAAAKRAAAKAKADAAERKRQEKLRKEREKSRTSGLSTDTSDLKGQKGDRLANAISAVQKEIIKRRKKRGEL